MQAALCQRWIDTDLKGNALLEGGRQYHHSRMSQLITYHIAHLAQHLIIRGIHGCGHHRNAAHLLHLRGNGLSLTQSRLALELRNLAAGGDKILQDSLHADLQRLRLRLQLRRQCIDGRTATAQIGFRAAPGKSLNTTNTSGDTGLLYRNIETNLTSSAAVRPTT